MLVQSTPPATSDKTNCARISQNVHRIGFTRQPAQRRRQSRKISGPGRTSATYVHFSLEAQRRCQKHSKFPLSSATYHHDDFEPFQKSHWEERSCHRRLGAEGLQHRAAINLASPPTTNYEGETERKPLASGGEGLTVFWQTGACAGEGERYRIGLSSMLNKVRLEEAWRCQQRRLPDYPRPAKGL